MIRQTFIIWLVFTSFCAAQVKYIVPADSDLLGISRKIIIEQEGIVEATGNNDGKEIAAYLQSVGLQEGAPYCAAGQYYCFAEAQKQLFEYQCKFAEIPIKKTGLANGIFNDAKIRGVQAEYLPAIDDLLTWRKKDHWSGHIERIIAVDKGGWVITIGFNTSNGKTGSQREGNGVFYRKRNIYLPLSRLLIRGIIGFESE